MEAMMQSFTTPIIAATLVLLGLVAPSPSGAQIAGYQRVILVSWDGIRRDTLLELLDADPAAPCWRDGDVFPVPTGRLNGSGEPGYTCLPALAGIKPAGALETSPAYGPFQIFAAHTTNDGETYTKPQHASMFTGYDVLDHGLIGNKTAARIVPGITLYERLMDAFDPVTPTGRNGFVFRTHHSADRKYIGSSIYYWAKRSRALQVTTSHGLETPGNPGAIKHATKSFAKWRADAIAHGLPDPGFFMFLHFKYPDTSGHVNGDGSRQYRQAIIQTDERLYQLFELLRQYGWTDAAVIVTTDHGFNGVYHSRNAGRDVINTWIAAHNVQLTTDHVPLRTAEDYCASQQDPADCTLNGPEIPMPPEDVVPNVILTSIAPTILDMFGVEWRSDPKITAESLYQP
jgi:hypothetical protein